MTVSIRHPMTMPRLAGRAVAVSLGALVAATSFNALAAAPAHAGTAEPAQSDTAGWTVTAPSEGSGLSAAGPSGPRAVLHHDRAAGTVTLAVERAGRAVLQPAPVGIVTEQVDLSTGLRALGRRDRVVVERYDTTVGKRRQRTAIFQEARFSFAGAGGSRLDLIVRVARDGVAYRYALPDNRGAVLREASAFTLPAASPAWLAPFSVYYENPFAQTTSDGAAAGEYMHPALFETPGGYALLTESDVDGRYSGARLTHDAGSNTYRVKLADDKVLVDGPLTTPWRTAIVGDLDTVAASTLVDDLAPRSKVGDTGWIQPGKAFWSWLAGGRDAGQSLKIQKGYVDFAAAHGWPYVVVDAGWNRDPNWDPDPTWEQTSWLPELVRYGRARNVKIMTWIHFEDLDTAEERARRLPLFEKWGIVGLKIDFMDSDAQERYRWYDQILPETAAYHLMINFHGSTIPHGIHRTWPHVVTMEGVWGAEHSRDLASTHLTALPFTRDVVGSMDYTPMAWHRPNRPTSDAHELALSVVFESGLQNFAGRIDGYDARPEAERFLDQVPTVWDDTRLLAGRPADSAVFARRSGDRWFIGGGFAGAARTAQVPLALPAGRWLVDLVRDGATGLVREPRVATAGDTPRRRRGRQRWVRRDRLPVAPGDHHMRQAGFPGTGDDGHARPGADRRDAGQLVHGQRTVHCGRSAHGHRRDARAARAGRLDGAGPAGPRRAAAARPGAQGHLDDHRAGGEPHLRIPRRPGGGPVPGRAPGVGRRADHAGAQLETARVRLGVPERSCFCHRDQRARCGRAGHHERWGGRR